MKERRLSRPFAAWTWGCSSSPNTPAAPLAENSETEEDASAAGEMSPADEIAELRRKLGRLGSVNLEAIQELTVG